MENSTQKKECLPQYIERDRLIIRTLDESDWQNMKKIFIDFNNSKYSVYDMPLPAEDEEIKALTKTFAESKLFFAVFLKKSKAMIGYVCFHKAADNYDLGVLFSLGISLKRLCLRKHGNAYRTACL